MFYNTNALLYSDSSYYYPYAIGIKTGFTTPAGCCLVAGSSHNELEFIAVVLGSTENDDGYSQRYSDTIKLFNFAFSNYSIQALKNKDDIVGIVQIPNATSDTKDLKIACDRDISIFMESNNSDISPEVTLKENLLAPIQKGDIVGTLKYTSFGVLYETNLIASENVVEESILPLIIKINMGIFAVILITICIIGSKKKTSVSEIRIFKL